MSEDLKKLALSESEQLKVYWDYMFHIKEGDDYTLEYFLSTYLLVKYEKTCFKDFLFLYFPMLEGTRATLESDPSTGNSDVAGKEYRAGLSPACFANLHNDAVPDADARTFLFPDINSKKQ